MRAVTIPAFLFVLGWLAGGNASAAEATAQLDRPVIQLGETVTLTIALEGRGGGEPDLAPLAGDFEVLGTSSASSMRIVNGEVSASLQWQVTLKPRREGTLAIPALDVGGARTAPLTLEVRPEPTGPVGTPGGGVFIEVEAEPSAPFVQEQVSVTVRLFYGIRLLDGGLDELAGDGAVIEKLGRDASYQTERGGRVYGVLERRYAVFPQRSGTLELPPVDFRGRAPPSGDPSRLLFGQGRTVTARGPAVVLEVAPQPPETAGRPWLPARELVVEAERGEPGADVRVGDPVTLTLAVRAVGAGYAQIPEIELPAIDGAEIYPDQSVTRSTSDGVWTLGERSREFAIIPQRAGRLEIPPLAITWWDTTRDRLRVARSEAQVIEVLPAAGAARDTAPGAPVAATAPPDPATQDDAIPMPASASDALARELAWWRAAALASVALWLALVAVLAWRRHRARAGAAVAAVPARPSSSAARATFRETARGADPARAERALLGWAHAEGLAARSLGELASQLAAADQREAIAALQRALYAPEADARVPDALAQAFRSGFARVLAPRSHHGASSPALPPLWPHVDAAGAERKAPHSAT